MTSRSVSETRSDRALSSDIRLLGRLPGEVIRTQAGAATFDLVELVRRRAVAASRQPSTRALSTRARRRTPTRRAIADLRRSWVAA